MRECACDCACARLYARERKRKWVRETGMKWQAKCEEGITRMIVRKRIRRTKKNGKKNDDDNNNAKRFVPQTTELITAMITTLRWLYIRKFDRLEFVLNSYTLSILLFDYKIF